MVSLSLEHGNGDGSCFGYVWFAMFAGPRFGNYKDGFRFGQLGYDLVETRGFARYQARTYITFSTLMPWARHASNARELVRRAFDVACRMGDLTFSAYSWHVLITNCLFVGDSLELVQSEVETGLTFATKQGFGLVAANCGAQLGLVRTLRGLTRSFGSFDADDYSESETERHLAANPGLALAEFFYWTRKLQARFFAEDYAAAVDAAQRARRLLWPASSQVETGDFRFYGALAHAAAWSAASGAEKQRHFEALIEHHRQLEVWAGNCPENFENRATLVAAEIARIEGRALDAEQLYERAICLARVNGFVHNEAVASELAARFHRARGLATIADGCLRDALVCYGQWGARGKLNQLHARHPHLRAPRASSLSTAISNAVAHLDAETVVKASQTLSSEMNPPSFIEKLMRLAVENAGAERGLLILSHSDGLCIEAEATIGRDKIDVAVRQVEVTASDLPQSVLQYVLRARERLVFDDVSASAAHADDPYVQEKRPRSLLCLPILTRTKVVGALYLENTLTESSFTSDRVAVLEFIASQAAISLENARLYSGLTRSEALLAEAQKLSLTGSFGWNAATGELFWSEQNYAILELDRTLKPSIELVFSRCHPDDISMVQQMLEQATREGANLDFGHRLLMPDGRIKHVHVMAHIRGDAPGGQEFVGAIMDVTASYQSRIALSDAREELAHVARITTMGELAASIAHEVNQPLGAIVANANACLRWLSHQPPKLDEARESVRQIILDGNRGSEVVTGIRTFLKREQPHGEALSVNDVIRGIIALLRNELREVAVQVELADDLPLVVVDRVQLQQVLLNLTMNAIDAMKPLTDAPRILRIETRHEEGHGILVAVQDSGIGLDAGQMQKLFEPFYTTKPQGLGMGLSICRTIIERHGGCLWMEHNEGPGATFKFSCLPREEDVPT
jgi:signal transduction histidine kinase